MSTFIHLPWRAGDQDNHRFAHVLPRGNSQPSIWETHNDSEHGRLPLDKEPLVAIARASVSIRVTTRKFVAGQGYSDAQLSLPGSELVCVF